MSEFNDFVCFLCSAADLKGYPERRDYAAFRDKVRGIYNAFIIPVQNEGRVSLIADGERGRASVPGNVILLSVTHRYPVEFGKICVNKRNKRVFTPAYP